MDAGDSPLDRGAGGRSVERAFGRQYGGRETEWRTDRAYGAPARIWAWAALLPEPHSAHEFPADAEADNVVREADIEIVAAQNQTANAFFIGIVVMEVLGANKEIVGHRIFETAAGTPAGCMAAIVELIIALHASTALD